VVKNNIETNSEEIRLRDCSDIKFDIFRLLLYNLKSSLICGMSDFFNLYTIQKFGLYYIRIKVLYY